ncbi:hypothetical protein EV363DRAFT_1167372 [Boletus edulis]|nr:hypothetical protein EV363DRAFT_1167372 [Boletus edulis]
MSSLTRFPDVALPLPPRPIDAYVECTFVTNIFSLYEKTPGSDDREDTASRWHSSYYRPSGSVYPLSQALGGHPMPLTISAKDCPIQLSFQVKVHGFPIEEAINSPSCSIPAGRSDHQIELLAMSDI